MKRKLVLLLASSLLLVACEDRYRYYCQDPKNFADKRCQRPACLFSQDCPDYLVAPVLEKQSVQPQPTTEQQPAPADTRAN
jgi:hypothetical protein